MAEKKKETKIVLERVYTVPLRKEFQKAPKYKRTKKAVNALREFLIKHMKSENVKIGRYLNLHLWKNGIKNPPHHVKVECKKDSEGVVFAELVGAPKEKPKEEKKPKKAAKPKEEKKTEKPQDKSELEKQVEKKTEEIKEALEEKAEKIQKEEIKELAQEGPKHHAPKQAAAPKPSSKAKRTQKTVPKNN